MKTVEEIKQYIKLVKAEAEHLDNPKYVENHYYDGYLSALKWVLEDSEENDN